MYVVTAVLNTKQNKYLTANKEGSANNTTL